MNGGPGGCGMLVISPEAEENHDMSREKVHSPPIYYTHIFISLLL